MAMNKAGERLVNGLIKENPTFVLMLGMCPTLAVTSSAINGLGMGLTTAVVLALSNMIISLLRKIIPNRVRIPAFIVIIASFVTIVQLLLEAYLPDLNDALGVYIPLIVVNCIILGRAEAYAYSNTPIASLFDGIGMGLGFSVALTAIGAVRELLGSGKIFGIDLGLPFEPIGIFVLAPGAFFVLAALTALQNYFKIRGEKKGKDMSKVQSGCNEDCLNCGEKGCSKRFYDTEAAEEKVEETAVLENTASEEPVLEEKTEETVVTEPEKKAPKKKRTTKKAAEKKEPANTEITEENAKEESAKEESVKEESAQEESVSEETVKAEDSEKETSEKEAPEVSDKTVKEETPQEEKPVTKKKSSKKSTTKKAKKVEEVKTEEQLEVLDLDEEEDKA